MKNEMKGLADRLREIVMEEFNKGNLRDCFHPCVDQNKYHNTIVNFSVNFCLILDEEGNVFGDMENIRIGDESTYKHNGYDNKWEDEKEKSHPYDETDNFDGYDD